MTTASTRIAAIAAGLMFGSGIVMHDAHAQTSSDSTIQPELTTPEETEKPDAFKFSFGGGLIHQFDADIDGGGDFSVNRFSAALGAQKALSGAVDMTLRLTYGFDNYDFSDAFGLASSGSEPWGDIQTLAFGAVFTWHASQDVSWFGGPVFQSSRESGADFDDGITAGGIIGGSYAFSQEFVLGGGLIITSQIEDDVRIDPFIVIHWQVGDTTHFGSRTTGNILTRSGVEFVMDAGHGFELGLGIATYFSRFRLDDSGVAPDGVGQDESIPFWLRAAWQVNHNFRVEGMTGFAFAGTLRLEDDDGHRVAEQDYDPALFVGLFANVTF